MQFNILLTKKFKIIEFILFFFTGVTGGLLTFKFSSQSTIWLPLIISIISLFIVILIGNPKQFLLGLLILFIPFNVDKNFFLHQQHAGGAVGLSISLWEISLYFLVIIWILKVVQKKDQKIQFLAQWSIPIFGLIGVCLLSLINSSHIDLSIFEIVQLMKMYLLFFYIANCIQTENELRYVLIILFLTFFLENVLGLFQYFSGRSFNLAILGGGDEKLAESLGDETTIRVPGTFGTCNAFGSYLIMLLPLLLSTLYLETKKINKLFCILLLIMGIILLILTLSRGAWLGFVVSVLTVLLLINIKFGIKFRTILTVGIFLLTAAIIIYYFRETILLRFYGNDYGSAMSRITMMRTAFEMIKANPCFGVGINNYVEVMMNYDPTGLTYVYFQPVHNVYLKLAAEIGIFGLCIFLWFLFVLYKEALRNFKKMTDLASHVRIGLIGSITALLIHRMVDTGSLGDGLFILFWFFAGLLVATINLSSKINI